MHRLLTLPLLVACGSDPSPEGPAPGPVRGPGLGNLSWAEDQRFTPVSWIDTDNGIPEPHPDHPITTVKPFGTNVAYLHGGYMVSLFAPDSGFGPGGLLFHDVSDPADPKLVHRVYEPEPGGRTADFREAHSMAFSHVDGRELVALHTGTGMQLWDIAEVTDPEQVGVVELPGVRSGDYDNVAWQLAWQGRYVYVSGSSAGVFIVDVSDPTRPVLADRGGAPNPVPISALGGFRVGPLFAIGNLLIVSSMDNTTGYAVLDLTDPLHPALLATRTLSQRFYATCFSGGRVISSVRGSDARMTVDDVTDPWQLRFDSTHLELPEQLYCGTQDEYVFQGGEDQVVKVDLSDPSDPRVVGAATLDRHDVDHGQVTAFGNLVFVGNDHGTGSAFVVHDTAPDTTPPAVSFVSPADGAVGQGMRSRVGVTFTDNVTVEHLTPETFGLRPVGGAPLPGRITAQGHIVTFEPDQPLLPATTYELVVPAGGVTDWAGNPIAETFTSRFTTAEAVSDDLDAILDARIVPPGPVEVGQPVTLTLDVPSDAGGEVSWRLAEDLPWEHRADLGPVTHTYDAPGHYLVIASITNGVRRVSTTAMVTVHRPLSASPPSRSATLALDEARGRIWAVNRDHHSVSALDADTLERLHEVDVDPGPRAVAIAPDGTIWVTCEDAGTIWRLDGDTGEMLDTIALHPGASPAGIAASPTADRLFVALHGAGQIAAFDISGAEVGRIDVGPAPFGVAVAGDGQTVWATRKVSPDDGGQVYVTDPALTGASVLTVAPDTTTSDAEDRGRGLPNYLLVPAPTPDAHALWLPAKQDNIFRGLLRDGQPLTHESTVRAVVPRLTLADGQELGPRIDLNDRAPPVDVAFTPLGDWAFLALQGSDRVALLDAYTGQPVAEHVGAGRAPEGLVVSADGRRLYVHHFLSRTVTAHDLEPLALGDGFDLPRLATGSTVAEEVLAPAVLAGKRIFYAAFDPRMSKDGYIACASCHLDGGEDGRVWDFTDRGEGLRNTIDLRGRGGMGHGWLHWSGNFDEIQDFEGDIRQSFGGAGFLSDADWLDGDRSHPLGDPKAGLSPELDALAAYVSSLTAYPPSPWRTFDGALDDAAQRGALVFEDLGCADCHGGPHLTLSGPDERYDVGTLTAASGSRLGQPLDGLDIPTLRGLFATPPYLHDGSAPTVREVLTTANPDDAHGAISPLADEAVDDLVWYLLSLD